MAEAPPPQTGDAAVREFIGFFALGFVLAGVDILSRGGTWGKVCGFWVVGAVLSTVAFRWKWLKTKIGSRLVASLQQVASDARWWVAALLVFFIYLGLAPLIEKIKVASSPASASHAITGTADIPANAVTATIDVPLSLPYAIHGLTANWNSTVWVTAKDNGHFVVGFSTPAPAGGGALDWEVTSRSGRAYVAQPVHAATVAASAVPKSRWLNLDDAGKWQFVKWMRSDPNRCTAVIAHYSTPYAQEITEEYKEVLKYSDWTIFKGEPNEDFPFGISVISPKSNNSDPIWDCAIMVQNGLRQFSNISVPIKTIDGSAKTPNMGKCQDRCIELDIGNEPEPTPSP